MPACDRYLADRIRHIVDRNRKESLCNLFQRRRFGQSFSHRFERGVRGTGIKRLVTAGAEHGREEGRINPPKKQIAIGNGKRPALAIAGRAGVRARAFWPDAIACAVKGANRTAARGYGVDLHHRCGNPHPRDHTVAGQFIVTSVMRDIRAGSAHVEANQLLVPKRLASSDHADHPARWPRQNCILAAKRTHFGQSAVRLHETQAIGFGQFCAKSIGVAPQHRGEIGIHHRRIAARDQFDERRDLMAGADLCKAHFARKFGQPRLVLAVFPAMHQDNCDGIKAISAQSLK